MKKIDFTHGNHLFIENEKFKIIKVISLDSLLLENVSTNERIIANINQISSKEQQIGKNHSITAEYDSTPPKYWEEAKKRFSIIKPLINKITTKKEIIKYAKKLNIHYTTIYRWMKDYKKTETLSSLVPATYTRGGKDKTRIDKDTEKIIEHYIENLYLSKQKFSIEKTFMYIKKACINTNLKVPHYNTVRNRIKKISEKELIRKRESPRLAQRLFQNTEKKFPAGDFPLDVIQIDHTPMDIIIVDETYRKPIGRPFLTIAIDVYSRMITGFYIALQEPSYFSVSQCLSQSILTKEKVLRELEMEGEWPIFGIPKTIHADNGADFRSNNLKQTCEDYNIHIEWRPVARPQFGGHIERLIGTSMKEVHTIPGTTSSNIFQKGEYDSEKKSIMTLNELEKWFCDYIVNVYHKKIHLGINMTPLKKYEIGILGDEHTIGRGLPQRIEDQDAFTVSLLPYMDRTIQQTGVSFNKITYYDDCLRKWIKAKDKSGKMKKFRFRYDLRDISMLWFYDPDIKEYFPIHYRNITLPPISFWELSSVQTYLKEKNIKDYNENDIFIAYDRMSKIIEDSASKTKKARKALEAKKINKKRLKVKASQNKIQEEDSFDSIFNDAQAFENIEIGKIE